MFNLGDLVRYSYNPFFTAVILELEWDDFLMISKAKLLWDSGKIQDDVWCVDLELVR